MRLNRPLAALVVGIVLGATSAHAIELNNGRIDVQLATPKFGSETLTTNDKDRVNSISWINSAGVNTGNLAANFSGVSCGDLSFSWGDSYAATYGVDLYTIFGGVVSQWKHEEPGLSGIARTTGEPSCGYTWAAVVTTGYKLYTSSSLANALRVERNFHFLPNAPNEISDLRAYVPRMPFIPYRTVLYPGTDGLVHSYDSGQCVYPCQLSGWSGTWFADDDGHGDGLVVVRDRSSTWPAVIVVDNDDGGPLGNDATGANATSISLVQPAGGFTGEITEAEWLCFYDRTSWPATARNAGQLPTGCSIQTPKARGTPIGR